ncbi:MAG: prepilin-type N-terminal cleavage/methylation domain-containing protein [Candidatus Omnitrophica bacterium]|nr:prepilin-type N-terminal cleavage/methylation domain-containing protein [Candidatus Omnitrophota bacterium]
MRGFTLVELMVVIFIFSIIMAATFGVLSTGRQSWHTGSTQVELQQETRRAMDRMVRELRESGSTHISIPVGGGSITFQVPIDEDIIDTTVDDDVLDVNGNIEWGAGGNLGRSIQYLLGGLNNRQLLRRVLNGYPIGVQVGADVILANNIRSDSPPPNALMFVGSPAGNPIVISIEVSAQKDAVPGRTMQSTLNSQVTLRNLRN